MATEFVHFLKEHGDYIIGLETCPSTGRKHIQGYIEFKVKTRPMEKFRDKYPTIHWEPAKGSREANIRYCSKDGNFMSNLVKVSKSPMAAFKGHEMYPWQEELNLIVQQKPDDRTIHWFYDEKGNTGKTTMAKYLYRKYKTALCSGRGADVLHLVSSFIEENNGELDIALFTFTRSIENFVSYQSLEYVKDGLFASGKYEGAMVDIDSPHVIVFANFPPDRSKLSLDRWVVHTTGSSLPAVDFFESL